MTVGEQDREELAELLAVSNGSPVNPNFSGGGRVKADQELGECGLAAAVAAHDENQLSASQAQVDGPKQEIVARAAGVGVHYADELETAATRRQRVIIDRRIARRDGCLQGKAESLDRLRADAGTPQDGEPGHDRFERGDRV